jgi:hypothetical protein
VHEVDLVGEAREERGLFERRVAASDDRDLLLLEEGSRFSSSSPSLRYAEPVA